MPRGGQMKPDPAAQAKVKAADAAVKKKLTDQANQKKAPLPKPVGRRGNSKKEF